MKRITVSLYIAVIITMLCSGQAFPQINKESLPQVSGQWFLTYRSGESGGKPDSQFLIKRGYITIRKKLNDRISGRITPDISVDRDGDGEGDLEMRLKYCYADLKLDNFGLLNNPHIEFGLVHAPWVDFQQRIYRYRLQGTMFLDRNNVTRSSDFGVTFFALIGGTMNEQYRKEVNDANPGRYGSLAFGTYNGGGYHAIEQNNNKTVEGRLTLRPLPDVLPGMQCSYLGIYGKGNSATSPDLEVNALCLSYQQRYCILTGTYYDGTGDYKGSKDDAIAQDGWSVFGEWKIPLYSLSVIGRYDYFDSDEESKRAIAGVAYHIDTKTKVLLDYDIVTSDTWSDFEEAFAQVTVEYGF